MLKAAVGHSIDPDSQAAIAEVLAQCDRQLAGARPVAGILLAAIDFDCAGILQTVVAAYPGIGSDDGLQDARTIEINGSEQDTGHGTRTRELAIALGQDFGDRSLRIWIDTVTDSSF